jgi:hypothetical protein
LSLSGLLVPQVRAQKETAAALADVIELPRLTVTDTRELPPPEAWRYLSFQRFEVLSSASDRATVRLIRDFDMFVTAVGQVWPLKTRPMPRTAIVLCKNSKQFESFLPPKEASAKENRTSASFYDQERGFIVLNLGVNNINLDPLDADLDPGSSALATFEVNYYKQLYREYVRYRFSLAENRPPVWYEEGVSQILMNMDVRKKELVIGELESLPTTAPPPSLDNEQPTQAESMYTTDAYAPSDVMPGATSVPDRDFNIALARRALIPLDQLFAVTRDSPNAINPIGNNRWAKQCYAIVHYCLYGRGSRYKTALDKFIEITSKTPATEEIFQECFGKTYKQFLLELRGYINVTDYRTDIKTIKGDDTFESPISEIRDATEDESARIKGDAFRVAGQAKAARDTLAAAYIRGARDPHFLVTLGQAELANGAPERARKFLEAGAPKTDRPSVLIDLARLRLEAVTAQPAGADKKINNVQLVSVLNPLLTVCARPPASPEAYELIASAWLAAETKPTPQENLVVLTEGIKAHPQHAGIFYHTARLYAHIGQVQLARAIATQGLKVATTDFDRERLTALRTQLASAATPTPNPPPAK